IKKYFNKRENVYIATKVINQLINLEIQVVLKAYNQEMNRLKIEEERAKEKLMYLAFYDEITGLPKRNKITSDVDDLIKNNKKFGLINMEVRHVRFLGESSQSELKHLLLAIKDRLNNALINIYDYQLGKLNGLEF